MIKHAQYYFAFVALTMVSLTSVAQFTPDAPAEPQQAATDAADPPADAAPIEAAFDAVLPSVNKGLVDADAYDVAHPSVGTDRSAIPVFDGATTAASQPDSATLPAGVYSPQLDTGVRRQPDSPPVNGTTTRPSSTRPASVTPSQTVSIRYTIRRPETVKFRTPDGKTAEAVRYVVETQSVEIDVAEDLNTLDLPPEGKRIAVLTVTAARHQGLLEKLKAAKTPEEKEAATLAVRENYTEHYAIETWWREQKLAELETRLQELRAQVTQRQESEEKYVMAAMTIAELWAEGIGITPPTPSHVPVGVPAQPIPGPSSYIQQSVSGSFSPVPAKPFLPGPGVSR